MSGLTAPPVATPARGRRLTIDRRRAGFATGMTLVFLAIWQAYAATADTPFELPTPINTTEAFFRQVSSGELWQALRESGAVVLAGGIPGIVLGILLGLLIGGSRALFIAANPYVFAMYTTPFVALIPLYLVLFGVGFIGKVSIVFTLVFLAVVIQTIAGVRTVDPRFLEVAASFGSGWTRTLFQIKFPAASSLVVAGIRLAFGRALVGVVVAEFDTAFSGLGAEIFRHSQRFRLADALVPALVLAFFGIVLAAILRQIEDRLERWRRVR